MPYLDSVTGAHHLSPCPITRESFSVWTIALAEGKMSFLLSWQCHWEVCRKMVGLTADGTGASMKHAGTHPYILVTSSSLEKLLESSLAGKALGSW